MDSAIMLRGILSLLCVVCDVKFKDYAPVEEALAASKDITLGAF